MALETHRVTPFLMRGDYAGLTSSRLSAYGCHAKRGKDVSFTGADSERMPNISGYCELTAVGQCPISTRQGVVHCT